MAESSDGYLSLKHLRDRKPTLAQGLEKFMSNGYMESLYSDCPESEAYLLYDKKLAAIIIDDPQLTFYLANMPIDRLALISGKV